MTMAELNAACARAESLHHERMILVRPLRGDWKRYGRKQTAQLVPGLTGRIVGLEPDKMILAIQTTDMRRYLCSRPSPPALRAAPEADRGA